MKLFVTNDEKGILSNIMKHEESKMIPSATNTDQRSSLKQGNAVHMAGLKEKPLLWTAFGEKKRSEIR